MVKWFGVFGLVFLFAACAKRKPATEFVAYDREHSCVIAIPENAGESERRAAELIQATLAKSSGKTKESFPIRRQGFDAQERFEVATIFISGSNHLKPGEPKLMEKVDWRVTPEWVSITSYPADAVEAAAGWFLRETLGARWFMPGELGEQIPARTELRLASGMRTYEPSYISRNLGLGGGNMEEQAWWRQNRLRAWFKHTHAMNDLFQPEDLRRHPELAATVNGLKIFPNAKDSNWQPNIAAAGAMEHAAGVLASRREFSSAIGMNDSIRFDQSEETRAAIGEPRWFRQKPDYSKLVFRFVNNVAKQVPGRYLGAYAYDWTENTPGFPIERNVVPYLTADRSEWFDPAFAEEDKALIKRWVASGAEVVGLYDYYYGAPYLVPRPTLYAVRQAIPFAYQAGVRAFYAEVYPNWGLDGPKAWLASELLWDATAKPDELLAIYYRDFWREAADSMREFYAQCDQQWLNQPKPSYWIKYFKDEHQHLLYPADVRQKLRGLLDAAKKQATSDLTKRRVEFASEAFAVTEAFCAWEEAKERLSRLALPERPDEVALRTAWKDFDARDKELKATHARVAKSAPLAVKATILGEYERNDPRLRAAWGVRAQSAKGEAASVKGQAQGGLVAPADLSGDELLKDVGLVDLKIQPPETSFDLEWVSAGPWRGHGEPYETRRVSLEQSAKREAASATATLEIGVAGASPLPLTALHPPSLVMQGCKQETFSQMVAATAGESYVARVKVRGKVSPGNMTFLILNFQDASGQPLGLGVVDRLPVGDYAEGVELVVWAKAPANAKWVGLGVRTLNQVGEDFAAFSSFSLQQTH